jgi:uncharacterized protein (TIGR02611 family)
MAQGRRSRAAWVRRHAVRVGLTVLGFVVLLAGLIMLVTPGPGLLVVIAGLALLAKEYAWAERFLHRLREKAEDGFHAATASPLRIALSVAITLGAITAVIMWWVWL